MTSTLHILDAGRQPYAQTLELQNRLVEDRKQGKGTDTLILVEHDRVYTLGCRGKKDHVIASEAELTQAGIPLIRTDRGGDVTYHGPGQVVAYPVISLAGRGEGVLWYVQNLEAVVIRVLDTFGLRGTTDPANRGVWIGTDKIAAIGVRVSRQITKHGFALNVRVHLDDYRNIIPCGIRDRGVTSLHLKVPGVEMDVVKERVVENFMQVFGYDQRS